MADLVLRGIEMPQTCVQCKLRYKLLCLPLSQSLGLRSHKPESGRLPGCPIMGQLQDGHGKLIDIEDVKSEKIHIEGRAEMYSAYNVGWNDALDAVCMNAHSVVPAEGGAE